MIMKTHLIASLIGLLVPLAAHAVDINVDFGREFTPASGWNNIRVGTAPTNTPIALLDSLGNATGISLSFDTYSTALYNDNGTQSPTGAAASLPATVTRDSIFGHVENFVSGSTTHLPVPAITFTLSGLEAGKAYQLSYFASRTGATVTDVRTANYSLTNGTDTSVVVLDAAQNTSSIASSAFLVPSASGTLTMTMTADATNTNANKFFYLGSLQIQSMTATIPEPGSFAMLAGGAAFGLVALRRRR